MAVHWKDPRQFETEFPGGFLHQGLGAADAALQAMVVDGSVPGISAAVLKNGQPLLLKGYGMARPEIGARVRVAHSKFRAASISKSITGTLFMRLYSAGVVDLQDSFYKYVPGFPAKAHDFNLAQLAAHTAGIRGYRGKEFALNKPMGIREGLQLVAMDPLLFPPGEGYHYNSYDYVLLSAALQEAYGKPFPEMVRDWVLTPLQMEDTVPETPDTRAAGQVDFFTRSGAGFRLATAVDNRYKLAGGGYLCTATDILKLGEAARLGSLEEARYWQEFLRARVVDGESTYYGLGWEVSSDPSGRAFFGHTGNSVGAYSLFRVYPGTGLNLVFLANLTNPGIETRLQEVIDLLFGFVSSPSNKMV